MGEKPSSSNFTSVVRELSLDLVRGMVILNLCKLRLILSNLFNFTHFLLVLPDLILGRWIFIMLIIVMQELFLRLTAKGEQLSLRGFLLLSKELEFVLEIVLG